MRWASLSGSPVRRWIDAARQRRRNQSNAAFFERPVFVLASLSRMVAAAPAVGRRTAAQCVATLALSAYVIWSWPFCTCSLTALSGGASSGQRRAGPGGGTASPLTRVMLSLSARLRCRPCSRYQSPWISVFPVPCRRSCCSPHLPPARGARLKRAETGNEQSQPAAPTQARAGVDFRGCDLRGHPA